MNYIQSLFIRDDQNPFINTFGWVAPHYHLMSWALSCLTLKKQLGSLKLYCNHKGKELLIDTLGLPYDEVYETMEGWEPPHPKLWALSKIHTYSIQEEPFLHIDGDVYLFNKLPERILAADITAQNIEEFTDYYYSFMHPINRKFVYKPACLINDFKTMENLHALNAGILGGCNVDFFKSYTSEAFKYVEANLESLQDIDADRFNVFFEQHLCYKMADEANLKVEYLLPQTYHDNSYLGLDRFHDIQSADATYFHLLGNYKADEFTCEQMAKTLLYLYPDYYYKIISLFPELASEYSQHDSDESYLTTYDNGAYLYDDKTTLNKHFTWKPKQLLSEQKDDYCSFVKQVYDFLDKRNRHSHQYLKGRDANSHLWFHKIINEQVKMKSSPVIQLLKTEYDWAKLYHSTKTSGIAYYNTLNDAEHLEKGDYYSLIVSELSPEGFSIYDIDEFEALILSQTEESISKQQLLEKLYEYADSDVKNNYADLFENLVSESLKRLILMKAIMPV